jgi:serine/threonine-protein kinase
MNPSSIGHYQVTSRIGQGGMGEVFRAKDTRLGREVAIKMVPEGYLGDAERMARFQREAQALAALNHPNIAAIYGIEDSGSGKALVLELVEGPTLADKLREGPLPLEEVLEIGRQIAEALETAHEKGIIHRDLKPANIKVTPEGRVKVLDFGLAKLADPASSSLPGADAALTQSPTITMEFTLPGTILGTAAYMSPEQARGKAIDRRTDVWSFGCVLFECLAGKKAFEGETVTDLIGAVLHKEPDWARLPARTPSALQLLLRKCLAKDRKNRLRDMADARLDLEQIVSGPASGNGSNSNDPAAPGPTAKSGAALAYAVLPWILLLGAAAWIFFSGGLETKKASGYSPRPQRFAITLATNASFKTANPAGSSILISPEGSKIAYVGSAVNSMNWLWRGIDEAEFRMIPESRKAVPGGAFSPDGRQFFFATMDGALKVFNFEGGLPAVLPDHAGFYFGADWGPNNQIVYATGEGLFLLDMNTSNPAVLLSKSGEAKDVMLLVGIKMHPRFLPGGETILYTALRARGEPLCLFSLNLKTKAEKEIGLLGAFNPSFFPATGHLLYGRDDVLWARAFDPAACAFAGPEFAVIHEMGRDWDRGAHQFSLSADGTLVYAPGRQSDRKTRPVWANESGALERLQVEPGDYSIARLSPDGRHLAVRKEQTNLVVIDLAAETVFPIAACKDGYPFAHDGTWIYFNEKDTIQRVRADRSSKPETILKLGGEMIRAEDLSKDGKKIVFVRSDKIGDLDIWMADLSAGEKPHPFIAHKDSGEVGPRFSPDGKWVAYASNVGSWYEVYVALADQSGYPIQVSKQGGWGPCWSPDGKRLYFVASGGHQFYCERKPGESLSFEEPRVFSNFQAESSGINQGAYYQVAPGPDGDRLLMFEALTPTFQPENAASAAVVVHFDQLLRGK